MTPDVTDFELYDKVGDFREAKVTISDGEATSRFKLRVAGSVLHRLEERAMMRLLAELVAPEMLRKQADDPELAMEIETFEVTSDNLDAVMKGRERPPEISE